MFKNIHHKAIKKFSLSGSIHDDSAIGRLKLEYIRLLNMEMKHLGYAPRLDIDPDFTIKYNHEKEFFSFNLSVYGSYVGKKSAQCTIGIDGTEVIYTQPNKSKESLLDQESTSNQK